MLGVEVNSMFQQEKMDSEIISNPMTGGVSLHKTVTEDLHAKIVSDKYIELSSLLDNKGEEIVYTLKSQSTDQGFHPVWSPLQPKAEPLSLLQWTKDFVKFALVYSDAHPGSLYSFTCLKC